MMGGKEPSLTTVREQIGRLRALARSAAAPDLYSQLLKQTFHLVPMRGIGLENRVMYRSRWNEDGRLFSDVSELLYPRANQKPNRFNGAGEGMLYAAESELGCIVELRAQLGRLFTIATIERTAELLVVPLGLTDKFPEPGRSLAQRLVADYWHRQAVKSVAEPHQYNPTIALSRFLLGSPIPEHPLGCFSGVVYPSAEGARVCSARTYNIALSPGATDRALRVSGATVYFMTSEPDTYRLNQANSCTVGSDGQLHWEFTFDEMQRRLAQKPSRLGP